MKVTKLLLAGFTFLTVTMQAQKSTQDILFTIDNKPYYTDEFIRVYNKNIDLVKDESQKDVDNYLDLFVAYKLKIRKAIQMGLDKNPRYQSELRTYRSQLSKNYTTDTAITEELIVEAYERYLKEIKASHILVMVDEDASPSDTLSAYNQLVDLRNRVLSGEDFGNLAARYSQDPSARENMGELGYFSTFRMVYPFETGAYTTPKGGVSMPVRTRFGYHLIKVDDVRANRGELTVAHIMIAKKNDEDSLKEKEIIFDLYKKIQQGEDFASLAKQFSDDKASASKGGVLSRFGSGQLSSSIFEDAAFALTSENPLSVPIETRFGWHIIKLIEKHPIKTLDEMRPEITRKIGRDERSRLIAESMNEKLRNRYQTEKKENTYQQVVKLLNDSFYESAWDPKPLKNDSQIILKIENAEYTARDFIAFLKEEQLKAVYHIKPLEKLAAYLFDKYLEKELNQYYLDHLEDEYPDFAAIMQEYRDGLLLFDLMEKEIWEKSKKDTTGYVNFYQKNIERYQWKERYDMVIFSTTDAKKAKSVRKLLKKQQDVSEVKKQLNKSNKIEVMASEGVFEKGQDAIPEGFIPIKGISEVLKEGDYYFVIKLNDILPAGPKSIEDCRGKVINDYQHFMESEWLSQLKKEFKVSVNTDVLQSVKEQIANP